jgi:hypothetical protein
MNTWFKGAQHTYRATMDAMDGVSTEDLPQTFPKFVVMYEFFRLLRGEEFLDYRGVVSHEEQRNLYVMEDEIAKKLNILRKKLDAHDPKTKYYIDSMRKQFDI